MSLDFRPNFDKIVELLLYLAHKKPGADKYQAVKFFYLADRAHLNKFGRPITFETYYALPYGPVASRAKELLEGNKWTMRAAGIKSLPFETKRIPRTGKEDLIVIGSPKRDVDFDLFSKSDIKIFDKVLEKYGDYDFDALYRLTHSHFAYKRAWAARPQASNAAPMRYDEMIESEQKRRQIVEDLGPIAPHL